MSARRRAFLLLTAAAALAVVMAAALPFLLLAGPARLADYAHRELVLRVVAERAAAGATTTSERAMALADYLHANLYIFPGIEILEENLSRDPLFYLVRSIGWCDQQAGVLVALARKLGIDGALLDLEPSTDPARHVVALLDIGGVYRVFDPYYGIVFTRADGEPATLDDLRSPARPVSDQYDAIVQFVGPGELDGYRNLFDTSAEHTVRRLTWGIARDTVSRLVDAWYFALGDRFVSLYQDLYFLAAAPSAPERARLLHLAGRLESARALYEAMRAEPAKHFDYGGAEDAFLAREPAEAGNFSVGVDFHLARLHLERGDVEMALKAFATIALDHSASPWAAKASYFAGAISEMRGDPEAAKHWYERARDDHATPAPGRYLALERGR